MSIAMLCYFLYLMRQFISRKTSSFLLRYTYFTAVIVRICNKNTEGELENMTSGLPAACEVVSGSTKREILPLIFSDNLLLISAQDQKM